MSYVAIRVKEVDTYAHPPTPATLRYVSQRGDTAATPGERIEAVRQATPPPPGRRSRLGYISKDDFAKLIGCSRTRVIAWTRDEDPNYPEERYRIRLAALSNGRFTPDDFRRPDQPGPIAVRLEQLAAELRNVKDALHVAGLAHDRLAAQVSAMAEREKEREAAPRAQTAAATSRRVRRQK